MFHHVKELQFDARVSGPDPRFARLLLEQCGRFLPAVRCPIPPLRP